jgi:hypothetical protein
VSDPLVQAAAGAVEPSTAEATVETVASEPAEPAPTVPDSPEPTTESVTSSVQQAPTEPPPPSIEPSEVTPQADSVQSIAGEATGTGGQTPDGSDGSEAGLTPAGGATDPVSEPAGGTADTTNPVADPTPTVDAQPPVANLDETVPAPTDTSGPVAGPTDAVAGATGDISQAADPLVSGGTSALDPVVHAADAGQPTVGSTEPILEPVSFDAPSNILQLPANLDAGVVDPVVGLPDPLVAPLLGATEGVAGSGAVAETVDGVVQPLVQVVDPLEPTASGVVDPVVGLPDPLVAPLLGAPDGANDVPMQAIDAAQPVFGAGAPHGLGESVRSAVDAIASGLAATSSAPARLAALVFLLGVMAARLSGTVSAVAGYAFAGAGVSVRSAWLTSWGSARCLVVNASQTMSTPFVSTASSPGSSFSAARRPRGNGSGVLAVLAGRGPLRPFDGSLNPRGILGSVGDSGLSRFLRVLLFIAAGLLTLAVLPARALRRRGFPWLRTGLRLSFAVIAASILLALGVVLLIAP